MRTVSRFESNLLRILHCFLGHTSVDQVLPTVLRAMQRPICLSRDAVEFVQQSLATGTVMLLTRGGAWCQQRHLRGDEIRDGSLWQRSKPDELGLEFSSASLDFLMWLTATDVGNKTTAWVPPLKALKGKSGQPVLTVGDQFLMYLAARALRDVSVVDHWYEQESFRGNALIALALPDQLAKSKGVSEVDFGFWMSGAGVNVMEALQDELADTWVRLEKDKCKISSGYAMMRLGEAQEAVLNQFFEAAEEHRRRDLGRFLLEAVDRLLGADAHCDQWVAGLDTTGMRLAHRNTVYDRATAFLQASERLRQWHAASIAVGYFDEGYAESQLFKSLWESSSADEAIRHAGRIVNELSF
jgi:hypothetical protein